MIGAGRNPAPRDFHEIRSGKILCTMQYFEQPMTAWRRRKMRTEGRKYRSIGTDMMESRHEQAIEHCSCKM